MGRKKESNQTKQKIRIKYQISLSGVKEICFILEKERAMRVRHERGRGDRSRNRTRSRSRERRKYPEESRSLSRHSESSRREFTLI